MQNLQKRKYQVGDLVRFFHFDPHVPSHYTQRMHKGWGIVCRIGENYLGGKAIHVKQMSGDGSIMIFAEGYLMPYEGVE